MHDRTSLREGFEYRFSPVDPVAGAHIDPCSAAIYETVVAKGIDGQPRPWLAERWAVSADGLEHRFFLREGLRFHSGAACDAKAVAGALEQCRWGDTRTRQIQYWDPVATVSAEDDRTLLIRSHYPTTRILPLLWGTHTTIFNPATRSSLGTAYGSADADGTGPYRLHQWSDERVVARRAETYSGVPHGLVQNGARAPSLDQLEWSTVLDPQERISLLRDGQVDCLHAPPVEMLAELEADERLEVLSVPQSSNIYFALNWSRRDLGFFDKNVRTAISLGIDRQGLVDELLLGRGSPTYGPVPPGAEFYDDAADRKGRHDTRRAEDLLDAAGWMRSSGGVRMRDGIALRFECVVQDDSVLLGAARIVKRQLELLGIMITLEPVPPFAPFYARIGQGPASFLSKWLWQDPIDALAGFTTTASQPRPNWQRASVPVLDYAFDRFRQAVSPEELAASAATIQSIIAEDLPLVPLCTPEDFFVRNRRLTGWRPIPNNLYPFYQDARFLPH